ncbi:MAG: TetR/AcrR family transcriptional regulator C-terminal ligand-binding domain-containing protein [Sphingomonas sp.]|nr:TetR/AcrR family transcriptional regulator C-terminal ligand-binding domain-containing protein [Sphingomonas sp.]
MADHHRRDHRVRLYAEAGREDLAVILRPGSTSEGVSTFRREGALKIAKSRPEFAEQETAAFDTGSFRSDLAATLGNLARVLSGPLGAPLIEIAGALQSGAAPGQAERFWESRRQHLAPMFDAAIERGELPADVDRDGLFSMAAGPLYFRRFIASQPLTEEWVQSVADQLCERYCRKG